MQTHLTPAIRTELSKHWSRYAPAFLGDDPALPVDAIWVPSTVRESREPAAFLHCTAIQAETRQIHVLALPAGTAELLRLILSPDEVVWLSHSSLPPTGEASVLSRDPLLSLSGESEAFRLRCLAQAPSGDLLLPSQLASGIPGLHLRVKSDAIQGRSACEFHWTPEGTLLCVERNTTTGALSESSVGLALASWYCSRTPIGCFSVDWTGPIYQSSPLTSLVLQTYQAIRLPALHLFMLLRSAGMGAAMDEVGLAQELNLPVQLVRERKAGLLRRIR